MSKRKVKAWRATARKWRGQRVTDSFWQWRTQILKSYWSTRRVVRDVRLAVLATGRFDLW